MKSAFYCLEVFECQTKVACGVALDLNVQYLIVHLPAPSP